MHDVDIDNQWRSGNKAVTTSELTVGDGLGIRTNGSLYRYYTVLSRCFGQILQSTVGKLKKPQVGIQV